MLVLMSFMELLNWTVTVKTAVLNSNGSYSCLNALN